MKHKLLLVLFGCLLCVSVAFGQEETAETDSGIVEEAVAIAPGSPVAPAPASMVTAVDKDNDQGHAMIVTWEISADDGAGTKAVIGYQILRSATPDGPWTDVGKVPFGETESENVGSKNPESEDYIPDFTAF